MSSQSVVEAGLRELLDRQAILDCIHRYTRGMDRMDRELALSSYHTDAIDDHTYFVGKAADFVDWAFAHHEKTHAGNTHMVLNHTCELDGDTAHTETYWMHVGRNRTGNPLTISGGRYIDRFERRSGKWAIAARVCLLEWRGILPKEEPSPEVLALIQAVGPSCRGKTDLSYQRPLRITRPLSPLPGKDATPAAQDSGQG